MTYSKRKILWQKVLFIIFIIFWFLCVLYLSFRNIQLLYENYVMFHNKTDTEKLNILLGKDYDTFDFISKNTSSNATILLLSETKNVFFDYYLYPRKIIWSNMPSDKITDQYIETHNIDIVISYDEHNNIIMAKKQ